MGWAFCGQDDQGRDIGYGVAATCDFPGCTEVIDRGLGHVCGPMHLSSEWGCANYFCEKHKYAHDCPYPQPEEDESPCPDGEHEWTGQQMGGSPDTAESYEWVGFCKRCGAENTD